MRIAFVIWDFWPDREGGSERQCRLMARLLAAKGHACEVIAARNRKENPSVVSDGAVNVHRLGRSAWRLRAAQQRVGRWLEPLKTRWSRLGWQAGINALDAVSFWTCLPAVRWARASFVRELELRFHLDHAFDAVLLHEPSWIAGPVALLGEKWGIPVFAQEATREALPPVPLDVPRRTAYDAARRRTHFIAMAPYLRADLEAKGVAPDRIFDLPNGVVLPTTTSSGGAGVLYVGNFSQGAHWKAFDVLLDAWTRVDRTGEKARLTLVGGGDVTTWQRRADSLGTGSTLRFAGYANDPGEFFARADVFVLPSRVEGMSNALLEAQSWGIACVVSDIPGNRAIVEHEVNGLVVPVGDPAALAVALTRLLHNPELRRCYGENARKRMLERHEAQTVVTRLENVLRQVKERGPR